MAPRRRHQARRKQIAEVSKQWFRLRDTYGVEVREPADTVLAVTVDVDALTHD